MTPVAMQILASWIDLDHFAIYGALVACMVLALAAGHWLGRRHQASGNVAAKEWVGIVDGPILAIYGLLLAFCFYGAMQRFDERRKLIVEESIVLASAYRQTDLLPEADRPLIQKLLRDYVETQSELRERGIEVEGWGELHRRSRAIFEQLWDAAVAATANPEAREARRALVATLGDIDRISTTSTTSPYLHPPLVIPVILLLLSMASAFLLGYQTSTIPRQSWVHLALFVIFFAAVTYLIVDLEYPRLGAIRIGDMKEFLNERHRAMEY